MGTNTVEERIKACIAEVLGVDVSKLTGDQSLSGDLGADDIDVAEIAMALEDEFRICISDEEMSKATNVNDLLALVARCNFDAA